MGDISKKTVVILLVITILVFTIATILVFKSVDYATSKKVSGYINNQGRVSLTIIGPAPGTTGTGNVAVNVVPQPKPIS